MGLARQRVFRALLVKGQFMSFGVPLGFTSALGIKDLLVSSPLRYGIELAGVLAS